MGQVSPSLLTRPIGWIWAFGMCILKGPSPGITYFAQSGMCILQMGWGYQAPVDLGLNIRPDKYKEPCLDGFGLACEHT